MVFLIESAGNVPWGAFPARAREKADPFAVETLDSNNVLEAEIEAIRAKAATGDIAAVTRKGALETKLMVS